MRVYTLWYELQSLFDRNNRGVGRTRCATTYIYASGGRRSFTGIKQNSTRSRKGRENDARYT